MSQPPMQEESNPFPAGSHVAMRLTDGTLLSLQIIKPFLPFTKSLVYLVRPETPTGSNNGLPPEIILKIFDPRYADERHASSTHGLRPHLWTLEAETAAVQYRQEIAEGTNRADDLTVHVLYRDGEAKPYLWEEHFYRYSMVSWENELDALRRLISLQGTIIPVLRIRKRPPSSGHTQHPTPRRTDRVYPRHNLGRLQHRWRPSKSPFCNLPSPGRRSQ